MSSLQPLYDVKNRLGYAAIAGTSLLGEDFRLRRAAENMAPLAAANPVFRKISAGLDKLLNAPAEERAGLLLDTLALVDAVAYTQGKSGIDGEMVPLPTGGGTYIPISYGQIQPLLTALTTTGGGRLEIIQSAWENHPEFFADYRILPAAVAGLRDSYGEISDLNEKILKSTGAVALPMLKKDFDPAGKREMARRVKVIAAIEGADASPWLKEILPQAKKDVRPEVILALGASRENAALLLDLSKSERGKNRDAVLESLARMDGEEIQSFWQTELSKNRQSVSFLAPSQADWASDLAAAGLRECLEQLLSAIQNGQEKLSEKEEKDAELWIDAAQRKSSPAMLEVWRWADGHLNELNRLKNHIGQPCLLPDKISDSLFYSLLLAEGGPLCGLCTELHGNDTSRAFWLPHAFTAAFLTRTPAEVYDAFSPYLLTKKPLLDNGKKRSCHTAVLRTLLRLQEIQSIHARDTLDRRWLLRLMDAAWTELPGKQIWYPTLGGNWAVGAVNSYEATILGLMDPEDPEHRTAAAEYFMNRMVTTADWHLYGRLVLSCGGNPTPRLAESLRRSAKDIYLYHVWLFCHEAENKVPTEDLIRILEAFLCSGRFRKGEESLAATAIPHTQELLKAGRPLPEWDVWWRMR